MKLQREHLEKMFPEKEEMIQIACPDGKEGCCVFHQAESNESKIYNAARNEIIDKLCGMEIKIPNCITVDNETFQQITDDSVDYQAVQETRDYFVGTLEDTLEVEDETN